MLTRAFVTEYIKGVKARVRIPLFDNDNLSESTLNRGESLEATISTLPNAKLNLKPGDVVYIEFNENRVQEPVILGVLSNEDSETYASLELDTLDVKTATNLSSDTTIGKVTKENIQYLEGLSSNAQGQINTLNQMCQSIVRLSIEGNSLVMIDTPWGLDSK